VGLLVKIWASKTAKRSRSNDTVDGRNPAPLEGTVVEIPLFTCFFYIQTVVVWDFFHQQYLSANS